MEVTKFKLVRQHHKLNIHCKIQKCALVLGRAKANVQVIDERIPFFPLNSTYISEKHCEISCDDQGVWRIKDLKSRNGTYLNKKKLVENQQRELRNGDMIGLGTSVLGPPNGKDFNVKNPKVYIFKFVEIDGHDDVTNEDPESRQSSFEDEPQTTFASCTESINNFSPRSARSPPSSKAKKRRFRQTPRRPIFLDSESEDDSSDGLSVASSTYKPPVVPKKPKLTPARRERERKNENSSRVNVSRKCPTETRKTDVRSKSSTLIEVEPKYQCNVQLSNVFQVNRYNRVTLLPVISKKIPKNMQASLINGPFWQSSVGKSNVFDCLAIWYILDTRDFAKLFQRKIRLAKFKMELRCMYYSKLVLYFTKDPRIMEKIISAKKNVSPFTKRNASSSDHSAGDGDVQILDNSDSSSIQSIKAANPISDDSDSDVRIIDNNGEKVQEDKPDEETSRESDEKNEEPVAGTSRSFYEDVHSSKSQSYTQSRKSRKESSEEPDAGTPEEKRPSKTQQTDTASYKSKKDKHNISVSKKTENDVKERPKILRDNRSDENSSKKSEFSKSQRPAAVRNKSHEESQKSTVTANKGNEAVNINDSSKQKEIVIGNNSKSKNEDTTSSRTTTDKSSKKSNATLKGDDSERSVRNSKDSTVSSKNYSQNKSRTDVTKSSTQGKLANQEKLVLCDDTLYKDICKWDPNWLQTQDLFSQPPKLEAEDHYRPALKLESVRKHYKDYHEYQTVFYPLMLHELWAAIHSDWNTNWIDALSRDGFESNVILEDCDFMENCPLAVVQNEQYPKKGVWVNVQCHISLKNMKDILGDFGLCIFVYSQRIKGKNKEERIEEKRKFAFVEYMHNSLEEQEDKTFKYSFTVTFHVTHGKNFQIALEKTGTIQRISCISGKIRNYKALLCLPKLPLYRNILNPQIIENPWCPNRQPQHESIVPCCKSLNVRQKSIVEYTAKRIMCTEEGKPDIMLIDGAPGTGKTKTIAGVIMQLVTSREFKSKVPSILVCTSSSTSLHQVVSRLDESFNRMSTPHPQMVIVNDRDNYFNFDYLERYTLDYLVLHKICSQDITFQKMVNNKRIVEIREKHNEIIDSVTIRVLDVVEKRYGLARNENPVMTPNFNLDMNSIIKKIMSSAQIVCCTLNMCSSSASKLNTFFQDVNTQRFTSSKFTCCIIDDANQASEMQSLDPLMYNFEKVVLVGDSKQLKATIESKKAKEYGYGQSLFHRLYDYYIKQNPTPVMTLREQYRSHEEILKWPNKYFYNGKLVTKPIRKNNIDCPLPPYLVYNCTGTEGVAFSGVTKEEEIVMIVELMKLMWTQTQVSSVNKEFTIGVILPHTEYKAQLLQRIREKIPDWASVVEVGAVEEFQGREKDIIVISCLRPDAIKYISGNKLNVALTRAIHSLSVIGNVDYFKTVDTWRNLVEDAGSRKLIHNIPANKIKQPGFIANRLRPILESRRTSEIPEESRRPNRLDL